MSTRLRSILHAITVISTLSAVGAIAEPSRETGIYVVRPGDTLRDLSRRYSGGEHLWPENWKLNPSIANPNLIEVGLTVRLLVSAPGAEEFARVTGIARRVEAKPEPIAWEPAQLDQLLLNQDGLRTRERSSAEMTFRDGKQLRLTESSLVFLRQVGNRLRGVPRDQIEIVEGQADLAARAQSERRRDVEIVVGSAHSRPSAGADGQLSTRQRKTAAGTAQLMVYEGQSAVEASGAKVNVARGMGTKVDEGKPPSPPEALLPAPELAEPASNAALALANPELAWKPVSGAASYTVEACADVECVKLVARQTGITTTSWRPEALPMENLFWRVTAVAASELDGYPSPARPLAVTAEVVDLTPPSIRLRAEGPAVTVASRLVLGPTAKFFLETSDAESATHSSTLILDGRSIGDGELDGGWSAGAHQLEITARDLAGNRAVAEPLAFTYDISAPTISWAIGGAEVYVAHGEPNSARAKREAREARLAGERRGDEARAALEYSSDGRRWLPVPSTAVTTVGERPFEARVVADRPQILLRATRSGVFDSNGPGELAPGRVLRLSAEDADSAVWYLRLALEADATRGATALRIETEDLVGNKSTLSWPITAR